MERRRGAAGRDGVVDQRREAGGARPGAASAQEERGAAAAPGRASGPRRTGGRRAAAAPPRPQLAHERRRGGRDPQREREHARRPRRRRRAARASRRRAARAVAERAGEQRLAAADGGDAGRAERATGAGSRAPCRGRRGRRGEPGDPEGEAERVEHEQHDPRRRRASRWPAASRQLSRLRPARERGARMVDADREQRHEHERAQGERQACIGARESISADLKRGSRNRRTLASMTRMAEQIAQIGELELCYETFGSPDDPALLLVMGLGTQMVGWPDGFCEQLAARGFHVDPLRQPRRRPLDPPARPPPADDAGSCSLRDKRAAALLARRHGRRTAIGLLDHLGIERAHVAGASMGGMIAQLDRGPAPGPRALARLDHVQHRAHRWKGTPGLRDLPDLRPPPRRRARRRDRVDRCRRSALIGSPGFPFDEEELRARRRA